MSEPMFDVDEGSRIDRLQNNTTNGGPLIRLRGESRLIEASGNTMGHSMPPPELEKSPTSNDQRKPAGRDGAARFKDIAQGTHLFVLAIVAVIGAIAYFLAA